jgi:hypothetical protein
MDKKIDKRTIKQGIKHLEKRVLKTKQTKILKAEKSRQNGNAYKCTKCKLSFDTNEFIKDSRYILGYKKTCKKCRSITSINSLRMKNYGMNNDEYKNFIIKNNNKCTSCGSVKRLCVDHCHTTGKVRGLLCAKCNTALGFLDDSEQKIKLLLKYLLSYS